MMKLVMSRYWKYQFAGWTAYSVAGITINLLAGGAIAPLLAGHAVLISAGVALTHLMRREVHRRRRPGDPLSREWPLLAMGTVTISVVLAALVIGVNRILTHGNWTVMSSVALWWGMFLATGVWTVLYVRFAERRAGEVRQQELREELRKARLLALEAQMNPHFLFNALNSIRALIEKDPPQAQELVTRLAHVLRNSLSADEQHTVPLEEELETARDYLELEAVRFGDRLRYRTDIAAGAGSLRVPRMALQTLVENAVKHGVSQAKGLVEIEIRARFHGEQLELRVANTGNLQEPGGVSGAQLGLRNTRERMRLLYGESQVRLEQEGNRVVATVMIPTMVNAYASPAD